MGVMLQTLFAGSLLALIAAPATAAQTISQFQPACYTSGFEAFAGCIFTPKYADNNYTTYSSVRQDVGFFASASSYDRPVPGLYVTSKLHGGQTVDFGAISFSGAMTGVSGYGFNKSVVSGIGQYTEYAVVSSSTLPLGSPVEFYVQHRLDHAANSHLNGLVGSIVTYNSNITATSAVTVLGNLSNWERSFNSQMSVAAPDIVNSRGGPPIEEAGIVRVLVGQTIEIFSNLSFEMGADWPSGVDSLGAENNFYRLMADTAQLRLSPISGGRILALSSSTSSTGSFYLVTESGFDYSSPFTVAVVPEPTSGTLFALGTTILIVLRARRRQKNLC